MEQQSDYQSPEQVKQEDQVTTSASLISTSTLKYAWVIYDNRAETKNRFLILCILVFNGCQIPLCPY